MGSPSLNPETPVEEVVVDEAVVDEAVVDEVVVDEAVVDEAVVEAVAEETAVSTAPEYKTDDRRSMEIVAGHILASVSIDPTVDTFNPAEKVPSNWTIVQSVDGAIGAKHCVTGRVFNGSVVDFNRLLK